MKRVNLFMLLGVFLCVTLVAEIVQLPDLKRPFFILADEKCLYITDGPTISIYSLQDLSLLKKFGKIGEGPGEFRVNPNRNAGSVMISIGEDKVLVNSIGRISFFTKEGRFIKEEKILDNIRFQFFKNRYVGETTAADDKKFYFVQNLYGADFKEIKELNRRETFFQREGTLNHFFIAPPVIEVSGEKIFINGEDDEISVFGKEGQKLNSIRYNYDKLEVSGKYKKEIDNWYQTYPPLKPLYTAFKGRITFPKYFPGIRKLSAADDNLYVLTYKKEREKSEFVIFDTNGKFIKKVNVPFAERDAFGWCPYIIKNGNLYQLVENEDEEEWELHINKIVL